MEVALLGGVGAGHLGGAAYARTCLGLGARGAPPPVDYAREASVHAVLRALVREGTVRLAHDLSDGGLAVALAEISTEVGGVYSLPDPTPGRLFGEDHSRALVAYAPAQRAAVLATAASAGAGPVEVLVLGATGGERFRIGAIDVAVMDLRAAYFDSFPSWVG
jgi:phosphoribosylformylglycinamidine synthase